MYFDTHTHLNVEAFEADLITVLENARRQGVSRMAVVGFDMPTIQKTLQLSQMYDDIYSIIGWHPVEAPSYNSAIEKKLIQLLDTPKVVALGEIGLDYHWMTSDKQTQEKVFRRQIQIANDVQLPISIHTRDAMADTYRILKSERFKTGIMHSFSGNVEEMKQFLDLGMYISLSGVVTFKKALDVQEVAKSVPLDRLLIETDAPYLTPVPYRGKRNEPAYVALVAQQIATLRGMNAHEIGRITSDNARNLFGL